MTMLSPSAKHQRSIFALLSFMYFNVFGILTSHAAERYLIGPQDRLMIHVSGIRRNTGEVYTWSALNGEFSVGAEGTLSLPLLGPIKAEGLTPDELATEIGNSIKIKADLADRPDASVEVTKYRPFFILGAIQQPGKYEFQPGLTVLQAVSIAQGLSRAADARTEQRTLLSSKGELRSLAIDRVNLYAKIARLKAEISTANNIDFGSQLRNFDSRTVEQATMNEQLLFVARRDSLKSQINAIEQAKETFSREISSLEDKSKLLDRQVELSRAELSTVSDLAAKGLTISGRKLASEQALAALSSNRLDVQIALIRAQQSLTRADRDAIELKSKLRQENLNDMAESKSKLDQNIEKSKTVETLIRNLSNQDFIESMGDDSSQVIVYRITRVNGGIIRTVDAHEHDLVEPNDVIKVIVIQNKDATETSNQANPKEAERLGLK